MLTGAVRAPTSAATGLVAGVVATGLGMLLVASPRAAMGLGAVVAIGLAVAAVVSRTGWGAGAVVFAGVMFLLVAGGRQFAQIQIGAAYITELVIALLFIWLVLVALADGTLTRSWVSGAAAVLVAGYVLVGLAAAAYGYSRGADPYWIARDAVLVAYAPVALLVIALFPGVDGARKLLRILYWAGAVATFGGLAYVAGAPGIEIIAPALGLQLAFFSVPVVARYTHGLSTRWWEWLLVATQIGVIVAAKPRTSWVAALVAVMVLVITGRRRYAIGMTAIVVCLAAATAALLAPQVLKPVGTKAASFSPANTSTDQSSANTSWRIQFWRQDIRYVARHPLTGAGLGPGANFCDPSTGECWDLRRSRDPLESSGPHNSFINIAYRTGLPGLVLALGLLWIAVRNARRKLPSLTARTALALFAFGVVTAFFAVALEGPFMGVPFWVMVGLLMTLGAEDGTESSPRAD